MPLKIIHHKEEETTKRKETLSIDDIEESITKVFFLCKNIVNILNTILTEKNILEFNQINDNKQNTDNNTDAINLFRFIAGKKTPIEIMFKITTIMQKINILANDFGISLSEKENKNEEVLTDEDIDIMVQLVKDFGEEKIREDAKEFRKKIATQNLSETEKKSNPIDVYDVYYNKEEKQD